MQAELHVLIERCLSGDQQAMADLVQRHQGQVYSLCYRMLGQRQDAEDAAQETFLRVLRSLARWDSQRDFEPWLLAIAANRCRTRLAQRRRRPASQMSEIVVADERPDSHGASELAEELHLVMGDLREEYRQAFLLFHQGQLSYIEIAEAMNCPVGTVKTWVHRARRELIDGLRRRGALEDSSDAVRRI